LKQRDIPIIVPHEDYDPECCGCIFPVARGEMADLVCNECGAVVNTVPAVEAEQILLRMAMSGGICSEICPRCAEVNTFPGFTSMETYTCRHCGKGVGVRRQVQ
jgi:hypothetical protein